MKRSLFADYSGTITAGGTAQALAGANSDRSHFILQNNSAGDLWLGFNGVASAGNGCIKLVAGAYYETPPNFTPTGSLSVFGATTGQAFTAKEG